MQYKRTPDGVLFVLIKIYSKKVKPAPEGAGSGSAYRVGQVGSCPTTAIAPYGESP